MVKLFDEDVLPFPSGGVETKRYMIAAAERYEWALECLKSAKVWAETADSYCTPLTTPPGEPSPECAMGHIDEAIADVKMLIRRVEENT